MSARRLRPDIARAKQGPLEYSMASSSRAPERSTAPSKQQIDGSRQAGRQIQEILRERIQSLTWVPGEVLSRNEIQLEFGVSQTPVRDALIRLAEEGLVEIYPQHATIVSRIDLKQAHQSQFLRTSLEQQVAEELARSPDPRLLDDLESQLHYMGMVSSRGDIEAFLEADWRFHQTMYQAAGVPDLWQLVKHQGSNLERYRKLYHRQNRAPQVLSDHRSIIEAIRNGDVQAARSRAKEHISRSLKNIEELRAQFPDYFKP